jgi:hypothetical protein
VPDYAASVATDDATAGPNDLDSANRDPQQQAPVGPAAEAPMAGGAGDSEPPTGLFVALGLVALTIIAVPALSRLFRRQRRFRDIGSGRAGPMEAWQELMESSVDYGGGVSEAETPRAFAARLAESVALGESDQHSLSQLLDAVERLRFSHAASSSSGQSLIADVTRLRRAMATSAPLPMRIRATLAPASALRGTYSRRPAGAPSSL